jgi:hypothetical protein
VIVRTDLPTRSSTSTSMPFLVRPARKPRTECGAQPIASTICGPLAPSLPHIMAGIRACFVSLCARGAATEMDAGRATKAARRPAMGRARGLMSLPGSSSHASSRTCAAARRMSPRPARPRPLVAGSSGRMITGAAIFRPSASSGPARASLAGRDVQLSYRRRGRLVARAGSGLHQLCASVIIAVATVGIFAWDGSVLVSHIALNRYGPSE